MNSGGDFQIDEDVTHTHTDTDMSCISLHIHQSKDPKISIIVNLCGQQSDERFESRDQDPPILYDFVIFFTGKTYLVDVGTRFDRHGAIYNPPQ